MFALPGPTQVTTPVAPTTVATLVLSLLHAPPGVPVVVNVAIVPGHPKFEFPIIVPAIAFGFTVTDLDETDGPPQPVIV